MLRHPTGVFLFRFEPQSFAQTLKTATPGAERQMVHHAFSTMLTCRT